jgi:hypothetical protein
MAWNRTLFCICATTSIVAGAGLYGYALIGGPPTAMWIGIGLSIWAGIALSIALKDQ